MIRSIPSLAFAVFLSGLAGAPAQVLEAVPLDPPGGARRALLPNGAVTRPDTLPPPGAGEDRFLAAPFSTERFPQGRQRIGIGRTDELPVAQLRVLDMITGETETLHVAVGGAAAYRRLGISVAACERPLGTDAVGDLAMLEIADARVRGQGPTFSGWMFAESPALSALDHPRYDVWLIACTTASVGEGVGSDQKSAERPNASSSSAR